MAVRIVHVDRRQEVRFGDRTAAEQYAKRYGGGRTKWQVVTVRRPTPGEPGLVPPTWP
ncbi:hypothetical protein GCM10022222_39370 [Amycolatopsis ultiminotia]|uniref:Uncharacterized protein n=1 Tax=Amycolatopsis ultiminotia TaxID=543629 RepID=A0ABP6WKR6_9PSEU